MDNGIGHSCPYALFCDGVKVPTCAENCYLCYCWEGIVGLQCSWCGAAIAWLGHSTHVGGRHEVELKGGSRGGIVTLGLALHPGSPVVMFDHSELLGTAGWQVVSSGWESGVTCLGGWTHHCRDLAFQCLGEWVRLWWWHVDPF